MQTNINLSIPGTNVRLGDLAKDVVNGFTGVASAYARHLTGCDRVMLEGVVGGDEQKFVSQWCDVMALEVVESNAVNATPMPEEVAPAG